MSACISRVEGGMVCSKNFV